MSGGAEAYLAALALAALALPAAGAAVLGLWLLLRDPPSEGLVAGLARGCLVGALAATVLLAAGMSWAGVGRFVVDLGPWFGAGHDGVRLELLVDGLTVPFMGLATLLLGAVGLFSVRYLHREPGFARFFFLLLLFAAGVLLLATAGSLELLFVGWELVGVTSVLLIAFFQGRPGPAEGGLVALAAYRTCDVGLLLAAILLHHGAASTRFVDLFPGPGWTDGPAALGPGLALAVGGLLAFSAAGKSAQVPFSSWLPRAMEGPTPSSAIFYGALSVHAGAYLLLRCGPILEAAPAVAAAVVLLGGATAAHGTFVGRVQTDVKSALAYASATQVGLIFVEIGLGLPRLALAHLVGHALLRTLQLLRAPSALREHREVSALLGRRPAPAPHAELLLPPPARAWVHRLALERGFHDAALERLVAPLLGLARRLDALERRIAPPPAPAGASVESSRAREEVAP